MFIIKLKTEYSHLIYPTLLTVAEVFGLLSVILVGLLFVENGFYPTYNWITNPFSYHPLMMTIGLLFCYGNAIVLYRTFKGTSKSIIKIVHASLLIISLAFAATGFAAIIRTKNVILKAPHFMSFHSWLGLATIICFVLQWIMGFVTFLAPQLNLVFRMAYLPSHRLWGKIIFLSAVAAVLTGLSEYGYGSSFFTPNDRERSRRLILNFFGVCTSLFSLIVIYLLSNPDYQRQPGGTVERHEQKL